MHLINSKSEILITLICKLLEVQRSVNKDFTEIKRRVYLYMSPQGKSQCEVTDTTVTRLPKGELPEI